jgi:hypothetical protein
MKAKDTIEVEKLLSEAAGPDQIRQYVRIYKLSRHKKALVRPSMQTPNLIWRMIHHKVKELGGCWSRTQELWEVPLA